MGVVIIKAVQDISSVYAERRRHRIWVKNLVLGYELLWLLLSAFLTGKIPDFLITGFLSLAASAQLQEFRSVLDNPFTSLLMTGHIRKVADFGYTGLVHHYLPARRRSLQNLAMLVSFVLGAIATGSLVNRFATGSLIVPMICLGLVLVVIDLKNKKQLI